MIPARKSLMPIVNADASWPAAAGWILNTAPLSVQNVVRRGLRDVGILEMPPGSNRSGRIDAYNLRAGVPVGSYWCAAAVGAWWQDAGLKVPPWYASCDNWLHWAHETGRWVPKGHNPPLGGAVLYGTDTDAKHIGLIIRVSPLILSLEGNTTVEGAAFSASRNGVAVSLKEVTASDPVLGYVSPFQLNT